jgi:hypothetical protein
LSRKLISVDICETAQLRGLAEKAVVYQPFGYCRRATSPRIAVNPRVLEIALAQHKKPAGERPAGQISDVSKT